MDEAKVLEPGFYFCEEINKAIAIDFHRLQNCFIGTCKYNRTHQKVSVQDILATIAWYKIQNYERIVGDDLFRVLNNINTLNEQC